MILRYSPQTFLPYTYSTLDLQLVKISFVKSCPKMDTKIVINEVFANGSHKPEYECTNWLGGLFKPNQSRCSKYIQSEKMIEKLNVKSETKYAQYSNRTTIYIVHWDHG
jgi:hypothetical protein